MLIVTDDGNSIVNSDQVYAFDRALLPDGREGVVSVTAANIRTPLTVGDADRVRKALAEIVKGVQGNRKVLDLRDVLGMREDTLPDQATSAAVQRMAAGGVVIPGGMPDPQAVIRAAEQAQRRAGNGGS
jgi:hypothetical protein